MKPSIGLYHTEKTSLGRRVMCWCHQISQNLQLLNERRVCHELLGPIEQQPTLVRLNHLKIGQTGVHIATSEKF